MPNNELPAPTGTPALWADLRAAGTEIIRARYQADWLAAEVKVRAAVVHLVDAYRPALTDDAVDKILDDAVDEAYGRGGDHVVAFVAAALGVPEPTPAGLLAEAVALIEDPGVMDDDPDRRLRFLALAQAVLAAAGADR